jgi:hypothetical protein
MENNGAFEVVTEIRRAKKKTDVIQLRKKKNQALEK